MLLPEELRIRRVELNLSQSDVAARLEVSQQTISRWERSVAAPGPGRIAELAEALNLDPSGLLRAAGYLLVSDQTPDTARPTVAELGRMTTEDLVWFIDAGWGHLRRRLAAAPTGRTSAD